MKTVPALEGTNPQLDALYEKVLLEAGFPGVNLEQHGLSPIPGRMLGNIRTHLRTHIETGAKEPYQDALSVAKNAREKVRETKGDLPAWGAANVIAVSRPIHEWDFSKLQSRLQKAIFSADYHRVLALKEVPLQKEALTKAIVELGLDESDVTASAQLLGKMWLSTINIYGGVIVKAVRKFQEETVRLKVEAIWARYKSEVGPGTEEAVRLAKKELANAEANAARKEIRNSIKGSDPLTLEGVREAVFNEVNGKLFLKHPPGVGMVIQLVQSNTLKVLHLTKDADIIAQLPDCKIENPDVRILTMKELVYGTPLQDTFKQRTLVQGRRQKTGSIDMSKSVIPLAVRIGQDWLAVDARGLLRTVKRLFPEFRKGLSLNALLAMFTTDGCIFFNREERKWQVRMNFKPGSVPVTMTRPLMAGQKVADAVGAKKTVVAALDIGVANPLVAKFIVDGEQDFDKAETFTPPSGGDLLSRVQERHIDLSARLEKQARESLPAELQKELADYESNVSEKAKIQLKELLKDRVSDEAWSRFEWNNVGHGKEPYISTFIGDTVDARKWDSHWVSLAKAKVAKVPEATRKLLNETVWDLKRKSDEYIKLSVFVRNEAQRLVNQVIAKARTYGEGYELVIAVEDLVMTGKFSDGRGRKQTPGWEGFFLPKEDRRWFKFLGVHKAVLDLAKDKGIKVVLCNPSNTSQHCPKCKHVGTKGPDTNRPSQAEFLCRKCGFNAHADEVGAFNVGMICVTGKSIRKPKVQKSKGKSKQK